MSNHDQTKVPTTQAGRGHAQGATALASPATIKPCRLLRAIHHAPRAGRASLCRNCHGLLRVCAKSGTAACQVLASGRDLL